jgi:hypothetical protein
MLGAMAWLTRRATSVVLAAAVLTAAGCADEGSGGAPYDVTVEVVSDEIAGWVSVAPGVLASTLGPGSNAPSGRGTTRSRQQQHPVKSWECSCAIDS